MFDNLIDNMKFYTATIFSIVIWGGCYCSVRLLSHEQTLIFK